MKITKIAIALLCSLTLALPLASCSSDRKDETTTNASDKMAYESYTTQLEHYMELIGSLQDELMAEKEESFIIQCQYKLEIEELQKEILSLKKHGVLDKVEDNDGAEDPDQHEETPKQFEETSAKNLFKCEIIDQKLTVTAFWGDGKDAELPQSVDGVPLKVIGDGAFKGAVISSISIPDGVESIGWFAFSGCRTLKSITIPSSVTAIGYGAFEYCSSDLTIICESGSYAEAYAKSWGINYVIK